MRETTGNGNAKYINTEEITLGMDQIIDIKLLFIWNAIDIYLATTQKIHVIS